MDQPLVSIILPVYNAQNHLARCIGSILNQTYKNIELIILNDGSKDHSLPVCEEFRAKDSRIVSLSDLKDCDVQYHHRQDVGAY